VNATRSAPPDFDGLAAGYRALEYIAFGRDLERARAQFLGRMSDRREILVLGEGDGRHLEQLVRAAPQARIHCVDASSAMLARAAERLERTGARERVRFEHADAFSLSLAPGRYDAVVTLFFLDCFRPEQAAGLIDLVRPGLQPGALWAWADFAVPPRGWARLRARAWLTVLYAFFRWRTGLQARELPAAEEMLERAGFHREASREFQGGLVRSALFSLSNPRAPRSVEAPGKG
jgi:ubiquinone/menaquinone biosynthesis C-methylase UbiE